MRKLFKNKRGQNVAEYAILIALVVGAIIAMQKFAQRGLQARVRDATEYMADTTDFDGVGGKAYNTGQFEPDYQRTDYTIDRSSGETKTANGYSNFQINADSTTTRASGGLQETEYNATGNVAGGQTF